MESEQLPEKTIKRWNEELVDLHKKAVVSYLSMEGVRFQTRKKILKLYDWYIGPSNIRSYIVVRPMSIFINALITNQLGKISYFTHYNGKKFLKKQNQKKPPKT